MPLNPTGSEIPRSLTQIGTTIDAALNGKADFVRVTDNPSTTTAASSYAITGTLEFDGTPITGPASLDFVSTNLWQGDSSSLSIESGKWRLIFGGLSVQGSWLSVQTTATRPENCTWIEEEDVSGAPILTFTRATVATTGQFALVDDGVYDPVMWQNLGTDVAQEWVPLTTATALSAHTTATGNVHGLSAANVRSILGVSTLSGSNTGDQNLSSYAPLASPALTGNPTAPTQTAGNDSTRIATTAFVAASFATTSAVAAGYQPLRGGVVFDFTRTTAPSDATGSNGSYTWTPPSWCTVMSFELIGGGGGGGSGRSGDAGTNRFPGAGGGGGARTIIIAHANTNQAMSIAVGAGGAGGAAVASGNGNAGLGGTNSTVSVNGTVVALAAGALNGGNGGTNASQNSGGNAGLIGFFQGFTGSRSTLVSSNGLSSNTLIVAGAGAPTGGGVDAANVQYAAGSSGGGSTGSPYGWQGGAGTAAATNGSNSVQQGNALAASIAGGGGGNASGQGGNGGNGLFGNGGGGGGSSLAPDLSGSGGNGGDGFVRITCWG
jgi:hypothetical protein